MKRVLPVLAGIGIFMLAVSSANAQVKMGSNPTTIQAGSLLELESTNRGFLLTRVSLGSTTTWGLQGSAVAGVAGSNGTQVFNTNASITGSTGYPALTGGIGLYYWDGTGWVGILGAAVANKYWGLTGNAGTTPPTAIGSSVGSANFWGTTDAKNLAVATANITRAVFDQNGSLYGGSGTYDATLNPLQSFVWGNNHKDSSNYALVAGYQNVIGNNSPYSIAIGFQDTASGGSSGAWAIGANNSATGLRAMALGYNNKVSGAGRALGTGNVVTNGTAVGVNNYAPGGVAIGSLDSVITNAYAFGSGAKLAHGNTIYIGTSQNSTATGSSQGSEMTFAMPIYRFLDNTGGSVVKMGIGITPTTSSTSMLAVNGTTKMGNNSTTLTSGSLLELEAIDKGLLLPRLSLTSTTAWAPLTGTGNTTTTAMQVYNTNASVTAGSTSYPILPGGAGIYYWDGTGWVGILGVAPANNKFWTLTGNANTNSNINFLGTIDNHALKFRVNNTLAGYLDSSASGKTFYGTGAGNLSSGNYNTAIGQQAMPNAGSTAANNTVLGYQASNLLAAGSNTTAIGYQAGYSNTANENMFIGASAGYSNTTGTGNTIQGYQAGNTNQTGSFNTYTGYQAGNNFYNTSNNTLIGYKAGATGTSGSGNTALGANAATAQINGANNTILGYNASANYTGGNYNTVTGAMVASAGPLNGNNNSIYGYYAAGSKGLGGSYNTLIGDSVAALQYTGNNNTMLGHAAGSNNQGNNNTLIGTWAGAAAYSSGTGNTFVGYQAGYNVNSGSTNTTVGTASGGNITGGSNNIAIGNNTNVADGNTSNQMNIGNTIFGTGMTGSLASPAGNVGINTSTPNSNLHVNGSVAASIRTVTVNNGTTASPVTIDLTSSDYTLILRGYNTASNAVIVRFPQASTCPGRIYVIATYLTAGTAGNTTANLNSNINYSSYNGSATEIKGSFGDQAAVGMLVGAQLNSGVGPVPVNNCRSTWQSDGTTWYNIGL